jgi:hypothetical protein
MFYLSEDKKIIKDSFGDKVGFFVNGKFCQILKQKNQKPIIADNRYLEGLSPLELEQVSELLQRIRI